MWREAAAPSDAPQQPPLAGIRVLELGHYVAAPFATRLLGDLGAEIIKVEPPGGDPVRQWGARFKGSAPWWSVHARNKKCISLDLKRPEARRIVLDLLRSCDAMIENFRPGQLARMGLGEAEMRAVKPDLVIARISGYGQDGPGRDQAAFGVIGEAIGGLRHLTDHGPGTSDLPPVRVGVSIGDSVAGIYAALAAADIPHTRVFSVADIPQDPQFRARQMVQEVADPQLGPILHPGVVPRMDGVSPMPRSTGPGIGADNDSVLRDLLGCDAARVAALRMEGVL